MGVVGALGSGVEGVEVGERACIENHVHCGECYFCKMGRVNLCNDSRSIGMNVDGGYSRHVVSAREVRAAPAGLKLDDAHGFGHADAGHGLSRRDEPRAGSRRARR